MPALLRAYGAGKIRRRYRRQCVHEVAIFKNWLFHTGCHTEPKNITVRSIQQILSITVIMVAVFFFS